MKKRLIVLLILSGFFLTPDSYAKGIGNKATFSEGDEIYTTSLTKKTRKGDDLTQDLSYVYLGNDGELVSIKVVTTSNVPAENIVDQKTEKIVKYPIKDNKKKNAKHAHLGVMDPDGSTKRVMRLTLLENSKVRVAFHKDDGND